MMEAAGVSEEESKLSVVHNSTSVVTVCFGCDSWRLTETPYKQ